MTTEIIINGDHPSTFFAFCNSCSDINEESGDPQEGPLQLSGDGVQSLEEAMGQTERHQQNYRTNHKTTVEGV
jgi:hypothetical protein